MVSFLASQVEWAGHVLHGIGRISGLSTGVRLLERVWKFICTEMSPGKLGYGSSVVVSVSC